MSKVHIFLFVSYLTLAAIPSSVLAQQDCPGVVPWRPKCPQYCCLEELDEPLEGQYCCGSCRDSFDPAVRNSFACKANYYLHQTWAVVLIACGIAFIVIVFCTCCCCCCCAPCRSRGRRTRSYNLAKVPPQHEHQHQHHQYHQYTFSTRYGSSGATANSERAPFLAPSAPPPSASLTSSYSAHYQQMKQQPPPYQETASFDTPGTSRAATHQLPPPLYRP